MKVLPYILSCVIIFGSLSSGEECEYAKEPAPENDYANPEPVPENDYANPEPVPECVTEEPETPPPTTTTTAAPTTAKPAKIKCDPKSIYYKIDGSCNNVQYPRRGLYNSTYSRLLPAAYSDGFRAQRMANDKSPLPGARQVRLAVFPNGNKLDSTRSLATMQWGQFVTHDMSLQMGGKSGTCCTADAKFQDNLSAFCSPIKILPNDPKLGCKMSCMNFTRTMTDQDLGIAKNPKAPAEQINTVTPWLDLSVLYDSDPAKHELLRLRKDGLMKSDTRNGQMYLPYNPNGAANVCRCNRANETACYLGGDKRLSENPHRILIQTILLREHNRLARELKKINPCWKDERLFQEARRINIAQYQRISYYEWLPAILGSQNLINDGLIFPDSKCYVDDYDCTLLPDISNENAHGALKHFHSQIVDVLKLMDANRNTLSRINMRDFIFRPSVIEFDNYFAQLSRGMLSQPSEDMDEIHVSQITENMAACNPKEFGIDLLSFDIQRDRDHSNRYYNDYRKYCGLPLAKCFDDFKDYIPQCTIDKLKKLYKSHNDVDLMVGGSLESKVKGSLVGPTFQCILEEQFKRSRKADRLWFEHEGAGFTPGQMVELRKSSLSRLFCDNESGMKQVQRNAFFSVKANSASLVKCCNIPAVDLNKWKE